LAFLVFGGGFFDCLALFFSGLASILTNFLLGRDTLFEAFHIERDDENENKW
jgi:uncharacterized membrane protein YjjP (DUF1212 family)